MLERSGKLGTCCEIVATRDKKKEGEDMDVDDIRSGGTISCARLNLRSTEGGDRFIRPSTNSRNHNRIKF